MQQYERAQAPMQTMGIPSQMYPMAAMPEQQLESMYPRIYFIIYPAVVSCCDMMDATYGSMYTPRREDVERMVDDITGKVEADVEAAIKEESGSSHERQFGFGGRPLLRGLVGILFLRELLRRRRRPHFGFPFGGGFGPGFGGGFGPGFGGGFGPGFGGGFGF